METIAKLKQLGLTEKEASIYIATLKTGEETISKIARMAGQKRPTTYLALDRLEMLGLVNQSIRGKKKLWKPVHPKRLKELADFRASQIENTLPELLAMYKEENEKPSIQMMEGLEGIKNAYRQAFSLINTKNEGLWIGDPALIDSRFPEILNEYKDSLRKIKDPYVREIIHGGPKSKEWVEKMSKWATKNYQIKYTNTKEYGETDQFIIENKIIFFSFGREVFVTVIESKELAQTQRMLFENLWNNIK